MKLFYMPGACSLAPHIVLEWIGAPYEAIKLTHEDTKKSEYLKLTPAGAVPLLQESDGWVLTENPAILSFLAETHPKAKLGPDDAPRARAEFNYWLSHFASDVHKSFVPIFGPQRFGVAEDQYDKLRQAAVEKVRVLMGRIDARMANKDHLIANRRSVLDAYLFVFLRWVDKKAGGLDAFPNLKRFAQRMKDDPAVQNVMQVEGLS